MDQVLYRFFDSEGTLLYVGISNNWQARLKQHYKDSEFHYEASVITLERFSQRHEVEAAERLAIQTENPKYNKAFNPNFENPTQHLTRIKFWVYSNLVPDDAHKGLVDELRELFLLDGDWERKTSGPIAYYLLENLPEWAKKYETHCDECIHTWNSAQIEMWSKSFREKKCR